MPHGGSWIQHQPAAVVLKEHVTSTHAFDTGAAASGNLGAILRLFAAVLASVAAASGLSAEVDLSKLPPASVAQADFTRDIRPIFERACFRCHGPERPKGGFRLDSRELALKGGDGGVDIVVGDGARSPLVHYIAGLVPDMLMPPEGKGDSLTSAEVGLIRGWIDQGAAWDSVAVAKEPKVEVTVRPTVRFITIEGNERLFRQHTGLTPGWSGGIEHFELIERPAEGRTWVFDGHALSGADDYKVGISYEKKDGWFARGGVEQYRRFYDDRGGYYELFQPPQSALGRDLHMDIGRAWLEVGLTSPHWPKMLIGYEYGTREGERNSLMWGPQVSIVDDQGNTEFRNIAPSFRSLNEDSHRIRFELSHEIGGYLIEDRFQGEFFNVRSERYQPEFFTPGQTTPDSTVLLRDRYDHFQAANAIRLEKAVREWFLVSGGYLYSRLDGEAFFSRDVLLPPDLPFNIPTSPYSQQILLEQQSHIFNANAHFGPWSGLSLSGGVQSDWTRQRGIGDVVLEDLAAARLDSNLDRSTVGEHFVFRYTGLPRSVVFAEARFEQETLGQFEEDIGGVQDFVRDTDAEGDMKEYLAGVTVSPFRFASLTTHYRRRLKETLYGHLRDEFPHGTPGDGYSAFIRGRDIERDEIQAKLTLRWTGWARSFLSYQRVMADYRTSTDPIPLDEVTPGGYLLAGAQEADVYSANLTINPLKRLYLSATLSYTDSSIETPANGNLAIETYRGFITSAIGSASYALDLRTDLKASYSFSKSDYLQSQGRDGLPLGMAYDWHRLIVGLGRQMSKTLRAQLQYAFYRYGEPYSRESNSYVAHGIFATATIRWP